MTPEAYAARIEAAKTREKKADPHKGFVLECLLKYPDMSSAQLYDWIKERTCLETLDFQERCFRDYVKSIREEYDIRKPETSRQYEAMDELPPGKIENVVKYAKHGFAEQRIFRDIDSFNADCIAWLKRTGNKKEHGTTKKIPAEVFTLEKEHLIPVSEYSFVVAANDSF